MIQASYVIIRETKEHPFWWQTEDSKPYMDYVNWILENRKDLYLEYIHHINDDETKFITGWITNSEKDFLDINRLILEKFPALNGVKASRLSMFNVSRASYCKFAGHKLVYQEEINGIKGTSRLII